MRLGVLLSSAVCAIVLASGVSSSTQTPAQQRNGRSLAVVGATLIDGQGGAPIRDAVVVARAGKFVSAGSRASVSVPADAEVIHAEGKYIIPGLIDGHVHYRTYLGELCLNYGVTTVFDLGNVSEWMMLLKEGIANGAITRIPNLYSSGWILEVPPPPGGGGGVKRGATFRVGVNGPDAARKLVAKMLDEQGMDYIKVFQGLPPDTLKAISEEAHKRGKIVLGHTDDVYESVNSGLDAVTHVWGIAETTLSPEDAKLHKAGRLDTPYANMVPANVDKVVAFMIEHKTPDNPLLIYEHYPSTDRAAQFRGETYEALGSADLGYITPDAKMAMLYQFDRVRSYQRRMGTFPFLDALTPQQVDAFKRGYRNAQDFVRKFTKAGGVVWVGTDTGGAAVVPGLAVHEEMQLLVDSGLTPMQALLAATKVPAEIFGKQKEVGVIAPGRSADLLVLDADPLRDISNTRKISSVILRGQKVELGYHWNYTLPFVNPVETDDVTSEYLAVPKIERVEPLVVNQGAPTTLALQGSGFSTRAQVMFNGSPVNTAFQSTTALSAEVPASLLSVAGTWNVTVVNPRPGGGQSNALGLMVRSTTPARAGGRQ